MPTTTNIYSIALRLLPNTPFAVSVSADNKRQEKPPVLMRGVPAILRVTLYDSEGMKIPPERLQELYAAYRLVIANDFDEDTPVLVSNSDGAHVDPENGWIELPMEVMETEELAALIGTRDRLDLGAELQMFNSSIQEEPIEARQFPVSIQNRRDMTAGGSEPSPGSINYYNKEETDERIASAIEGAQGISSQAIAALSGASGTVEPGKCYSLDMSEDFELSAAALEAGLFGEALLFVRPNTHVFSVAAGIELDADMTNGSGYRLLVSWTPYGVKVEQSGEWIVA